MRKAVIPIGSILLISFVLGSTVFRTQFANAASRLTSVFVTNDASHPVPVREQNTDANGNIRVHEQGTANVNVTNSSLSVSAPVVTGGGGAHRLAGGETFTPPSPQIATALMIHLTPGVIEVDFGYQGAGVATVLGPAASGSDSVVLSLTRPVEFDAVSCAAQSTSDICAVSWVGAQP